jgi:putative phosphoesterase
MTRIGLISDTHSFLDKKIFDIFKDVDEIWHAGDAGSIQVFDALRNFKPLRAVYGNIDGGEIRAEYPEDNRFAVEGLDVWMTHIGGYPGSYPPRVRNVLKVKPPDIFICGHSHILRVMRDPAFGNMLTLNPGAAGIHGFHKIKTVLRFNIDNKKVSAMEAVELGLRGSLEQENIV